MKIIMEKEKIYTIEEFYKLPKEQQTGCFEFFDGSKYWYKNGKLHRLDGPAVINIKLDIKIWCLDGYQYTEEKYKKLSFAILNNLEIFL